MAAAQRAGIVAKASARPARSELPARPAQGNCLALRSVGLAKVGSYLT